jgi:hypothetical protein
MGDWGQTPGVLLFDKKIVFCHAGVPVVVPNPEVMSKKNIS